MGRVIRIRNRALRNALVYRHRQHVEEAAFGRLVRLHRLVEVEMIATEIGEHRDVELALVEPVQL